ncbi:MAG: hypothetical protein J6K03_09795, partial [Oscillospiraceae bacterium]|nr:hypothetical protein [Oscillospiraceae bacterium]
MKRYTLNGQWNGKCINDGEIFSFLGTVPGSSIHDLITCGRLPKDIFWRDNADKAEAFENADYVYEKEFDFAPADGENHTLCFERLDTYCDIFLNGEKLATTKNGFIAHSFDITGKLMHGKNLLSVHFTSPITAVKDMPRYNGAFTTERMNTRRPQCTYGWDWVARFVSCGICGDVEIRTYKKNEIRIASTYVYTKYADSDSAEIGMDLTFDDLSADGIVNLSVLSPSGTECACLSRYCDEKFIQICMDIPKAKLWYPRGYGRQPLYTLIIRDENGSELSREVFGIRIAKIMQLPDEKGSEAYEKCQSIRNKTYDQNERHSGFILKINGKRILCMGANWVPTTPFCCGSTDKKITELLELCAQGGVNMLRIWGGGAFESRHFYTECSRLGILVTQDFLMACGQYPEEQDWFVEQLQQEASYAAKLIRNQPCLMWWSGDNENAVNGKDTDVNYNGRTSAFYGIAPVLYRLDPHRPFLPSSPFGGNKYASNTVGTTHNTQFLGDLILPYLLEADCSDYRDYWKKLRARFIAEEPQFGAACRNTLGKIMTEADIFGDDDAMWNYHTKNNPGLAVSIWDTTNISAKKLLGAFTSPEDKYFKLKYMQYEWIRLSMEQVRREMWFSSGIIFWMMNDCWPASSGWAIIDYYNKPKDAYYAFRRCAKDVVLSFDYEN